MTNDEIIENLNKLAWEGFTVVTRIDLGSVVLRERPITYDDIPKSILVRASRNETPDLPEVEGDSATHEIYRRLKQSFEERSVMPDLLMARAETAGEALIKVIEQAKEKDYI